MNWKEGLIYRDWQFAIGDVMIKTNIGSDRNYDVIGYKEFENFYNKAETDSTKKCINRAERLFKDLDVINPPTFDVRSEQLKRIFISTYELLDINSKSIKSNVEVAKDTLSRFSETYEKLRKDSNIPIIESENSIVRLVKKFRVNRNTI